MQRNFYHPFLRSLFCSIRTLNFVGKLWLWQFWIIKLRLGFTNLTIHSVLSKSKFLDLFLAVDLSLTPVRVCVGAHSSHHQDSNNTMLTTTVRKVCNTYIHNCRVATLRDLIGLRKYLSLDYIYWLKSLDPTKPNSIKVLKVFDPSNWLIGWSFQ